MAIQADAASTPRFPPFTPQFARQAATVWAGVPGGYQNTFNDNMLSSMLETL